MTATLRVLVDVEKERDRQEQIGAAKLAQGITWITCADPDMPGGDDRRYAVLGEEFGEVARALLEHEGDDHLREELVQVAAVAVAWAEAIDHRTQGRLRALLGDRQAIPSPIPEVAPANTGTVEGSGVDTDAAALLGAQPAAEESTGEVAAAGPAAPSPSSARDERIVCPHCHVAFFPRGFGTHLARKHRAIDAPAPAKAVLPPQPDPAPVADATSGEDRPAGEKGTGADAPLQLDPVGNPSPTSPSKHSYLCNRCILGFATRAERDEHQATHPPIPEPDSSGRASFHIPSGGGYT